MCSAGYGDNAAHLAFIRRVEGNPGTGAGFMRVFLGKIDKNLGFYSKFSVSPPVGRSTNDDAVTMAVII